MTTGIPAVDYLVWSAAALTAVTVIWAKFLRPIIHAAYKAEEALPVILSIADEFRPDSGHSLRDTIDQFTADVAELSAYAHTFKHQFANDLFALKGFHEVLDERVGELSADLAAVKTDVANIKAIIDRRSESR